MSNSFAVRTERLVKTFEGVEIIKGCTMSIPHGTIYGFLGPNGAGKTTVMKMLTGLLRPTAGRAEVLGMDVVTHRDQILRNIGAIIEVPIFYEHLSASENLSMHLAYMGAEGIDITKALSSVGLEHTGELPVSKFSMGMRQRLGIARALIHRPKLLILDEPINGLDLMAIRDIRTLFTDLVQNHGMTILLSSHIVSEIELIADIVGIIADGTVKLEVRLSEMKTQYPGGLEDYFIDVMSGGHEIA
ncbi:ABC transporter ATP-binding protein [Paenibacillus tarimensis]|uniref:ABC transporter ATP-binding protein n=1 Tax=Paenibacillus tarimensis TaxID=416012 RepID=UPI001F209CE1|nr:ATP-binding cassette domain-containing protein [Paenibacillus tarimensis]MCF2942962.1 ATP-binding cassette domain-containing protein [Paenibacillus tarimensis]